MAFPPYIGARDTNTHVQICPSCNRACTIKIGWCIFCLTWETLTLHPFTWRSGESNPFQWRKLHPLRHCSAAVAFPPCRPANPWRGQLKKMILVSPTCILLSQAIAGRDRCRQICNRIITIVPVGGFEPPFGNLIHDKPVV